MAELTSYQQEGIDKILREKRAKEIAAFLRLIADKLDQGEDVAVVTSFTQHFTDGPSAERHSIFSTKIPTYQTVTIDLR